MTAQQRITVLGSTGSIGVNTLDVIARHPRRFQVFALAAQSNHELLTAQCRAFRPRYAVLQNAVAAEACRNALHAAQLDTEVLAGEQALQDVAADAQVTTVMAAIVGAAGLKPTLAAARAGKRILLANKEALVMSGSLFMQAVRQSGAALLPIDSEHNAIFQVLPPNRGARLEEVGVRRIVLTASGGPFRTLSGAALKAVTPEQACKHPNWSMGRKISVDSATMMNKGLEVIEACWLFDARPEQVEIVIHPESVVHSMVAYQDGSVIAQLGNPDMRTPIAQALAFPERVDAGVAELDLVKIGRLNFEALDHARFPCVELAYRAIRRGGTSTAVLNAANEIAVAAFLAGELSFDLIPEVIRTTLDEVEGAPATCLEDVLAADSRAREWARDKVRTLSAPRHQQGVLTARGLRIDS
jgi:1-deoxy-D-xylulose-5-phosphate reductoisomerase